MENLDFSAILANLTPEQKTQLEQLATNLSGNVNPETVQRLASQLNIDIGSLGKLIRKMLYKPTKQRHARNEKCSCGSGKKYKKCCWTKKS